MPDAEVGKMTNPEVEVPSTSTSHFDIEAQNVSKTFGDSNVFSGITLSIQRGESVAIVGANGTGKSTFLRCMMGLLPIDEGQITVLGTGVNTASHRKLRQLRSEMGLVSQKHNLVPRMSVMSNVTQGMLGQKPGIRHWSQVFASSETRDAAMGALEKVGLAHLANRRADRLSGGQSQRVAIARALVAKPKIFVADEPTASLDPAAGEEVMELFFKLANDEGVTVVFISHNIEHALRYGDRVLGLADGRLKLDSSAARLSEKFLRGLYN